MSNGSRQQKESYKKSMGDAAALVCGRVAAAEGLCDAVTCKGRDVTRRRLDEGPRRRRRMGEDDKRGEEVEEEGGRERERRMWGAELWSGVFGGVEVDSVLVRSVSHWV